MSFPDELARRLWRFPTGAAQEALARRFDLPNEDWMQDWEYIVPLVEQLDTYLAAYTSGELNDDERFTLMEMMIQCVEDGASPAQRASVLRIAEENVALHLQTVWYWACLDYLDDEEAEPFDVAPAMRAILERHRAWWE